MNQQVASVINEYPKLIQTQVLHLRRLILLVAAENRITITETLKWNEPSYLSKSGSTIRIAWRKFDPKQCGLFFNCKTNLVETFKEIYSNIFKFEGNRAIIFNQEDEIPIAELKQCINLTLNYHKIKHLPLLGV